MLIKLEDRAFLDDLRAHFRRSAFEAEAHADDSLRVYPGHDRSDILAHLEIWQNLNPDARIRSVVVDRGRRNAGRVPLR
jgi:hypothetical protein